MTATQRALARHALGLQGSHAKSYRNHFVTGPGCIDHAEWISMVEAGEARHKAGSPISGGNDIFWLTTKGAKLAIRDGECLDAEDFPDA